MVKSGAATGALPESDDLDFTEGSNLRRTVRYNHHYELALDCVNLAATRLQGLQSHGATASKA
jgi:hypothetical protein